MPEWKVTLLRLFCFLNNASEKSTFFLKLEFKKSEPSQNTADINSALLSKRTFLKRTGPLKAVFKKIGRFSNVEPEKSASPSKVALRKPT